MESKNEVSVCVCSICLYKMYHLELFVRALREEQHQEVDSQKAESGLRNRMLKHACSGLEHIGI